MEKYDVAVIGGGTAGVIAANSAVRVQATCMATGQVAGAPAAIAVRTGIEPSKILMEDLRTVPERHRAIVP